MRTTKEDVEDTNGEEEQGFWFGGGCLESSEMGSGINLATPVYGDKPGSKLDWIGQTKDTAAVTYDGALVNGNDIILIFMQILD
mgnify:CR=1 FL=1